MWVCLCECVYIWLHILNKYLPLLKFETNFLVHTSLAEDKYLEIVYPAVVKIYSFIVTTSLALQNQLKA